MLTRSWGQIAAGFVAFGAAHLVEVAVWAQWFNGQYRPWFTNSGRAVVFTSACIFLAGGLIGGGGAPLMRALRIGLGAWIAMVAILLLAGDPGTIFPIVLLVGTAVIAASAVGGAFASAAFRAR